MPKRPQRVLTTTISMCPLSSFHLTNLGVAFRAALTDGKLPFLRRPPAGDRPCAAFQGSKWRAFTGGALLAPNMEHERIELPLAAGLPRVVVTFDDPTVARQVVALEGSWIRRTAWLILAEDGKWVLRMRYESKDGLAHRVNMAGQKVYARSNVTKHRRWPGAAPAEWPRNTQGAPIGTRAAIKVLGKDRALSLLAVQP